MSDATAALFNSPIAPAGAACWICLDDEPSEIDGGRLLRNCSCRGDSAGFAHLACLAEHARTVSDKASIDETSSTAVPWRYCPNCEQEYMGDVLLAMAEKYDEHTSHLPVESCRRFEALYLLAAARSRRFGDDDGALKIFEQLQEVIKSNERTNVLLTHMFLEKKAHILFMTACIYAAKLAGAIRLEKTYLQKAYNCAVEARDTYFDRDGPESMGVIECESMLGTLDRANELMAAGQSKTLAGKKAPNHSWSTEFALEKERKLYALTVEKFGAESSIGFRSTLDLAKALVKDGKVSEASSLLSGAHPKAKTLFGPSHEITTRIATALKNMPGEDVKQSLDVDGVPAQVSIHTSAPVKATIVGVHSRPELNMTCVEVLRSKKDNKYIVRLPTGSKFKALAMNLIFALGTPVVLRGLTEERHLNGKEGTIESYDENLKLYTVAVGESFCGPVKPGNVEVIIL